MLVVCCYCRGMIRHDPSGPPGAVSHGICPSCSDHFERLWDGMTLSEYLDTFPHPALVLDRGGRVLAANRKLADRFGVERRELPGSSRGEAVACERSRLPGGCGKTVHCRDCTIRRVVTSVAQTGEPVERVPAYVSASGRRVSLLVSARAREAFVEVVLEEQVSAGPGGGAGERAGSAL